MKIYFNNKGHWVNWMYKGLHWKRKVSNKIIYLTFDDGPIPEVTPWVLSVLNKYNIKATFFCVGGNIEKYPELYIEVLKNGHRTGNHTDNHLKGFTTNNASYYANVMIAESRMNLLENRLKEHQNNNKNRLFRPPYGQITIPQSIELSKQYDIIMWDVITGDFNSKESNEECLSRSLVKSRPGSIVVFHDSVKSFEKLKTVLPMYIEKMLAKGYQFDLL